VDTFNAVTYTDSSEDPRYRLDQVPATFALRFDLDYPSGRKVVLIYETMPTEGEQQELLRKLQTAASEAKFTVTRTDANGTIVAPSI
jgi:hypothetical protein